MNISRGEIWKVNLDPDIGAEIRKTRPVVVVSSDAIGALPIRLVASRAWMVLSKLDETVSMTCFSCFSLNLLIFFIAGKSKKSEPQAIQ